MQRKKLEFQLLLKRICGSQLPVYYALRVKKDQINDFRCYNCYDFRGYEEVPEAWHATKNRIFDHGFIERWNLSDFKSAYRRRN